MGGRSKYDYAGLTPHKDNHGRVGRDSKRWNQVWGVTVGTSNIQFPATAVPSTDANVLDDYEEGTYTATLTCGTSGTITLNTSFNTLSYTKIGNLVTINGNLVVASVSSPVGALTLNLPIAIGAKTETSEYFTGSVLHYQINNLAPGGNLAIRGLTGSSVTIPEQTLGTLSDDAADHIKATSQLYFSFTYFSA